MQITVWTTAQCNLKCSYCYENKNNVPERKSRILDEEKTIAYVISRMTSNNVILFHGGEPLLNFPFIQSATEAILKNDDKCRFGFTTNGTIWTDEIENFFKKNKDNFEDWISISIDGKPEFHNLSRKYKNGKGSFHTVVKSSERILKIFPEIRARMTVTSQNSKGLAENIDFLVELGFTKIVPVIDLYDKGWTDQDLNCLSVEIDKIIEKYTNQQKVTIGLLEECRYLRKRGFCTFSPNIYVDGNIYPCTYAVGSKRFIIGDIWSGIDREKEENLRNLMNRDNDECIGCTNLDYCIYNRCKFLNYSVEGDFNTPCEVGCTYENIKVEKIKKHFVC